MKIVFFGAGSMAEALISGWVHSPTLPPLSLYVTNKSDHATLKRLEATYDTSCVVDHPESVETADFVVLAMKPKDVKDAFPAIRPQISGHTTVISVIAGIDMELLETAFPGHAIVRAMPNTSATIGKSATVLSTNNLVSASTLEFVTQLFEAIGTVAVMPDDQMHAVTAVSGSGPAYVYYVTELLQQAAKEQGLPDEDAEALVLQTLEGAVAMLRETNEKPATLRHRVTSPGGTTEAGLRQMKQRGIETAITEGIAAATAQSHVLGQAVKDVMLPSRKS